MRYLAPLFVIALLLAGCGQARQPASPEKAKADQSAVEADAGLQAARLMLAAAMTPALGEIFDGSAAFARATIGEDVKPAPTWTVERIVADPHAYRLAGESAERHANGSWNLWALGVAVLTLGPTLLYAAKFIPGVGPWVEPIGGFLWARFSQRATRDQEQQRDAIYAHVSDLYHGAMAALPTPAAADIRAKLPDPVLRAILAAPRPPAESPL